MLFDNYKRKIYKSKFFKLLKNKKNFNSCRCKFNKIKDLAKSKKVKIFLMWCDPFMTGFVSEKINHTIGRMW